METLQFIDYSPALKVPVSIKEKYIYRSIMQLDDYLIAISERAVKIWKLSSQANEPPMFSTEKI